MPTITVPDGYNGDTVELDADDILDRSGPILKLHVVGRPHVIRWIYVDDFRRLTGKEV